MKLINTIRDIIQEQDKDKGKKWISTEEKNFVMKHKKYIADCVKDPKKHKFCEKLLSLMDVTSTTTTTTHLPESTVAATTRKGRANWSPEAEQDLSAFHPEIKKDLLGMEEDYQTGHGTEFTSTDRRMLRAIHDVLVKGGAGGGYKSSRKRALTPLGYIPDVDER